MVGRTLEIDELNRLYESTESEFLALYGRRRVGKTYLVRTVFDGRFAFAHVGKANGTCREQLAHFAKSLQEYSGQRGGVPRNWEEAFDALKALLLASEERRKVVFIDEMPWMDTPRSGFLSALDSFWNGWASARRDVLLIVCGSAASWMVKNLFRNRGGLHNRVTAKMCLMPFTLAECEHYVEERGLSMGRSEITECYMAIGGIPYYWRYLQRGLGLGQNLDRMFFAVNAPLKGEFGELYKSLFKNARSYEAVVTALAVKQVGMTRDEIVEAVGKGVEGPLSVILETLEYSGFIRRYRAFGKRKKAAVYQLIDNFTLFHFRFIADGTSDECFWTATSQSSACAFWRGLAFERLCLQHLPQIRRTLGIGGVHMEAYAWRHRGDEVYPEGVQIDLVLDRADGVINVCEMKFSTAEFAFDAESERAVRRKLAVFAGVTGTRKTLHLTLVTSFGLVRNRHAGIVQSAVILDDLFS